MSDGEAEFFNDNRPHKLVLGESFKRNSNSAFHMMRYDFKPASVDKNQAGQLEVGDTNEVTVSLPHMVGSKTPCTVYKGSKKPAQKDCVLIFDHNTGEFTLERISSQIQVKKTRVAGNNSNNFSSHPVLAPGPPKLPKTLLSSKNQQKSSSSNKSFTSRKMEASKRKNNESGNTSAQDINPPQLPKSVESSPPQNLLSHAPEKQQEPVGSMYSISTDDSHSSSSSDSDSSDDGDSSGEDNAPSPPPVASKPPVTQSQLHEDLELSESGSDSD
uniref:ELL-associated factor 1-like n=1 Tax=Styela clava TaxID=7725 RepID=UPI001939F9DF|nr:ELL-associated factor 1-like [Styela clava]